MHKRAEATEARKRSTARAAARATRAAGEEGHASLAHTIARDTYEQSWWGRRQSGQTECAEP